MIMNMKLSDGVLKKFNSDTSCYHEDYPCEIPTIYHTIKLSFEGNDGNCYEFVIECKNAEIDTFISFFWNQDYSDITMQEFCDEFKFYLGGPDMRFLEYFTFSKV